MAEDRMVGWHHRLDGHEFEEALETGDVQGRLLQSMRSQSPEMTEPPEMTED